MQTLRNHIVGMLRVRFPELLRILRVAKYRASRIRSMNAGAASATKKAGADGEDEAYARLIDLTTRARQMTERNRQLERLVSERRDEKASNNEIYKKQTLFHQYLMFDINPQIILNAVLRKEAFGEPSSCPVPPKEIPIELVERFTLGGRMKVVDHWVDDTYPGNYPLIYTEAEISAYLRRVSEGMTYIYGGLDESVREALAKYPVNGLRVVNLGSITPWYEATLLHFGAKPTTLDYNTILTHTDRIETLVVPEVKLDELQFDAALSISSFEHDGLGAYGDPLDPDGDLHAMKRLKKIVKPGGLLYLNVPTGPDQLMWNRARVYGKARLPLLMEGWTWVDSFGMREEFLEGKFNGDPLFVLRND